MSPSDLFNFITEGVLLTLVSTFGLVGNLLSIIVLTRTIKNSQNKNCGGRVGHESRGQATFSILLRGLATFDALFLLVAILAFGLPHLSEWYTNNVFMRIMASSFGLLHTFRVGSVYVTLAVTFERFHAIMCPLKHFRWKKYLLSLAVSFAILYNIPKYFEMETKVDPETKMVIIESTQLRQDPLYVSIYVFWSKFIMIEIIPYFSILIMNIIIAIKLSQSSQFRNRFLSGRRKSSTPMMANEEEEELNIMDTNQTMSEISGEQLNNQFKNKICCFLKDQQHFTKAPVTATSSINLEQQPIAQQQSNNSGKSDEKSLSAILLGMSALFIACQSLKIVPDLYELIVCHQTLHKVGHHCKMDGPIINGVVRLSHLLVCINSSANFLIYYVNGTKFRRAWLNTYSPFFRCCYSSNFNDAIESAGATLTTQGSNKVTSPRQKETVVAKKSINSSLSGGGEASKTSDHNKLTDICVPPPTSALTGVHNEAMAKFRALHGPTLV